jgi:hypothetical protein
MSSILDELDEAEQEALVELAKARANGTISRRDVTLGAAGLGAGALAGGGVSAAMQREKQKSEPVPSEGESANALGSADDRVDVTAGRVDSQSVSANRLYTRSRAAEVVVQTDGDTYYADGPAGPLAAGADAASVIQAAIDHGPGRISVGVGTYPIASPITMANDRYLVGVPKGRPDSTGTVLQADADLEAIVDATDLDTFGIEGINVHGKRETYSVANGIVTGHTSKSWRTKQLRLRDIFIERVSGTGLNLGIGGDHTKYADDSIVDHVHANRCGTGIENAFTQVDFRSCRLSLCDTGVVIPPYSAHVYYSCVWSGNGVDVELVREADENFNKQGFHDCWFENSEDTIVRHTARNGTPSWPTVPITFDNCLFHTFGSPLMDLNSLETSILLFGGRVLPKTHDDTIDSSKETVVHNVGMGISAATRPSVSGAAERNDVLST